MRMRRQVAGLRRDDIIGAAKRFVIPALLTLALAGAAGAYALARIVETTRPELALSLMPGLPPALAAKGDAMLAQSGAGQPANLASAREVALRSLRSTALDAPALRTLAVTGPQQAEHLRRLLDMALRVSRRDVGTHLMQIETHVARNDIKGALRHYDQALRVRPSAGALLYPILLSAASEPAILRGIREMVSKDPAWLPGMITWSIDNPDFLAPLTLIVGSIPPGSEALAPGYGQALVESLVEGRQLAHAFAIHQAYTRGEEVRGFSGGFTYRPIDWTLADEYGYGAQLIERPAPHVLFYAEPGSEGIFLYRLAALPPGRYRIVFTAAKPEDESRGSLSFLASCQSGEEDRALSRARYPVASGRFAHEFTVPAGSCPFQWLRFSVVSGAGSLAADLTGIALTRVGAQTAG